MGDYGGSCHWVWRVAGLKVKVMAVVEVRESRGFASLA